MCLSLSLHGSMTLVKCISFQYIHVYNTFPSCHLCIVPHFFPPLPLVSSYGQLFHFLHYLLFTFSTRNHFGLMQTWLFHTFLPSHKCPKEIAYDVSSTQDTNAIYDQNSWDNINFHWFCKTRKILIHHGASAVHPISPSFTVWEHICCTKLYKFFSSPKEEIALTDTY